MIFLLLTKLPRGPRSFQWLISIMKSLGDPLCISHFIFTHSKECAIPWVYPAHTGQSLLYSLACSCCLPLLQAARLAWYFFFFFCCLHQGGHLYVLSAVARAFARTTSSSSVVPLPLHFLSSVGLPPSFLFCFWQNRRSNEAWPSQSKISDLWGTAFLTCPLSFEVSSLRGMHRRVRASNVTIFLKLLDDGLLRLHQ